MGRLKHETVEWTPLVVGFFEYSVTICLDLDHLHFVHCEINNKPGVPLFGLDIFSSHVRSSADSTHP